MNRVAPALVAGSIALSALLPARAAPPGEVLKIGYLAVADDRRHAARESYAGLVLRGAIDPFQGAELAVREAKVLARAIGLSLELERREGKTAQALTEAARGLAKSGTRLIVIDAPGDIVADVARGTREAGLTLFSVSAPSDELRGRACQPHLFSVLPSRAMLSDALAQYLASRRWTRVLVLKGPRPADARRVAAFERSAGRFGLEIVDVRQFTQSNDPRRRDSNNIRLLTEGTAHDVVYVADTQRELGRQVPYGTKLPRPVVGTEGLQAAAWHWAWERHGAPQLNRRFENHAGRRMTDADWAAWAAVKLIARAAAAERTGDAARIVAGIGSPNLSFDTYKGNPGSFRPWNNQLRQPILLHTDNAVIARAPIAGFLHRESYLDTLGADAPESACRLGG